MIKPTPTEQRLTMRRADFATLGEALDYAGEGDTGFNFYSGRGELVHAMPYRELRDEARATARRFLSLNLAEGTVKNHASRIMQKLHANTRTELAVLVLARRKQP